MNRSENSQKIRGFSDSNTVIKATVPDGGYGWVVCMSCFVGWFTIGGLFKSFGIILPALKEYFSEGTVIISLVGSVLTGLSLVIGPLVANLMDRVGLRVVHMIGFLSCGSSKWS